MQSYDSEDEPDRKLSDELAQLKDPNRLQRAASNFELAWKISSAAKVSHAPTQRAGACTWVLILFVYPLTCRVPRPLTAADALPGGAVPVLRGFRRDRVQLLPRHRWVPSFWGKAGTRQREPPQKRFAPVTLACVPAGRAVPQCYAVRACASAAKVTEAAPPSSATSLTCSRRRLATRRLPDDRRHSRHVCRDAQQPLPGLQGHGESRAGCTLELETHSRRDTSSFRTAAADSRHGPVPPPYLPPFVPACLPGRRHRSSV